MYKNKETTRRKTNPFCKTHTYPNMSEMIKLFGHTIQLVPDKDKLIPTATKASSHHFLLNSSTATSHDTKEPIQSNYKSSKGESIGTEVVEQANEEPGTPNVGEETTIEELGGPTTLSGNSEDPETPGADKEASSPEKINQEDPSDTSNSDEKTLKKPDKLLPCPRCNSMDTKFCYYNNYNVNQPRHFCKKCQRYWTAGGTMRNMPVGSGRRKNKSSPASHYRHIIVSEALQAARADAATGMHQPNSSMLMFRSDSTICESITSAMNLAEKSQNCVKNRFQGNEPRIQFPYRVQEIGDDNSSGSSTTVLNPNGRGLNLKDLQGSPPQVPCFPVSPWPTPWNTAQWRSSDQQPAFGPPGFPISFYPTPPYWGCPAPNPWNMQWLSPPCSSAELSAFRPGPNSQTLGKHPRDGSTLRPSNPEKVEHEETDLEIGVLTPKTLRIHDPNEAAKSSIWSTLGIKNEHTKSVDEASLHKAFRPKGVQKNHMTKASMLLQANPAALHRSRNFQEAT